MRYLALCRPFSTDGYVHLPADASFDPRELVSSEDHERWSGPGEPTMYLAGDVGVALAELGRHTPRLPAAGRDTRRLIRLAIGVDRMLDLTRQETLDAIGIGGPGSFMDSDETRRLARTVRETGDCQGILVPSVAFLDDPKRWNVVLFVEHLPGGPSGAVTDPVEVGTVTLGM